MTNKHQITNSIRSYNINHFAKKPQDDESRRPAEYLNPKRNSIRLYQN